MKTLVEAIQVADQLTSEDQAGLAAHLLAGIRACPLGPDDGELERREAVTLNDGRQPDFSIAETSLALNRQEVVRSSRNAFKDW